jgi:hypothetical protein
VGTIVCNTSIESAIDQNLLPGITYYYQAWSYNATDTVFSETYASAVNTTEQNTRVSVTNPDPVNNSIDCLTNLTFSIDINDSEGDLFNWTIQVNDTFSASASLDTNGTKTLSLTNLSYETDYMVWVNATDGFNWTRCFYRFTTEIPPDNEKPMISMISVDTSSPMDISTGFGWENMSCTITDNYRVENATVNITYPDASTSNLSLTQITGTDEWSLNTSFSDHGNYSFIVYALDARGNINSSNSVLLSLAPNWDVNNDGICDLLDFNAISNSYGSEGNSGWIREDVDNNGKISVLDLALVSEHYEDGWWN